MAPVIAKMLRKNEGKQCNAGVRLTRQGSFREERTPDEEKVDLKRKFLSDLVLLLNHSKINRRYNLTQTFTCSVRVRSDWQVRICSFYRNWA